MKNITIILLLYFLHFVHSWLRFMKRKENIQIHTFPSSHGKIYNSVQQARYRMLTLSKNAQNIKNLNADPNVSYPQGLTYYADFAQDQFDVMILNPQTSKTPGALKGIPNYANTFPLQQNKSLKFLNPLYLLVQNLRKIKYQIKNKKQQNIARLSSSSQKNNVKSKDWRNQQKVSHVKMQGNCGNCYSFSTTGAIQGAYMIKNNLKNVSYSDQQITDCCTKQQFGCNGCQGGWQWQAMRYVAKYGIVSQEQYPTISSDSGEVGKCQKLISPTKVLDVKKPFTTLQPGNITALYQAVSKQPVAVGIDASNMQFVLSQDSTKVFSNCSSKPQDANHAMLVVGFDEQGNWILKNSWSIFWGNKGYIKIEKGNTCGVANFAMYPNIA